MRVITNIRKSDLLRLHLHFLPRLKGNWIFVAAIAAGVVAWAVYTSRGPFTPNKLGIAVFAGLVGGLAGMLIATTANFLVILASSTQKAGVLGIHEYEIRRDGLFEKTAANEQLSKWSGIAEIKASGVGLPKSKLRRPLYSSGLTASFSISSRGRVSTPLANMKNSSPHCAIAGNPHLPNNAFEQAVELRGPRLAAVRASWPAAQLGRYTS
jgi:hypothetical protein